MSQIVRYRRPARVGLSRQNKALAIKATARAVQYGLNRLARLGKRKATDQIIKSVKGRRVSFRPTYRHRKRKGQYRKVVAREAGTTNTTAKMITRKTPRQIRRLRKLFRTNPLKVKHVQRFGFQWIAQEESSTQETKNNICGWYSVCHLKFNNVSEYYRKRIVNSYQFVGNVATTASNNNMDIQTRSMGNMPDNLMYIYQYILNYLAYFP